MMLVSMAVVSPGFNSVSGADECISYPIDVDLHKVGGVASSVVRIIVSWHFDLNRPFLYSSLNAEYPRD